LNNEGIERRIVGNTDLDALDYLDKRKYRT
jgi:hypothetical protein